MWAFYNFRIMEIRALGVLVNPYKFYIPLNTQRAWFQSSLSFVHDFLVEANKEEIAQFLDSKSDTYYNEMVEEFNEKYLSEKEKSRVIDRLLWRAE